MQHTNSAGAGFADVIERQETLVQRPDFNQGLEGHCRRKAIHLPAFLPHSPAMSEDSSAPQRRRRRTKMQRGCLKRQTRKRGPDVWQARPVGKGKLYLTFVGVCDRDYSVVRPHQASHPLPFLDISRSASRMVLRMRANVLPHQSVSFAISSSIRSDGFIGSVCLEFLSRFHTSKFIE